MALRSDTPIPGLFLTGQDVGTCGFVSAMITGVLAVSKALDSNLFLQLTSAYSAELKMVASSKQKTD